MKHTKILERSCLFFLTFVFLSLTTTAPASAHGSIETPLSRVYNCYLEGPEDPVTAACQAAVAAGGSQALYDWNGVNIAQADGQHREIIPDGKLCSAGREQHKGLDLPRDDWFFTEINPDAAGNFEFVYHATAPHSTRYFEFYITKPGYDPTLPLAWSDLEDEPFCVINNVELVNQRYAMTCPLPPARDGKHVIYNIWQRLDSPEAFYACIDIEFGSSAEIDSDNDGVLDGLDNCTVESNPLQVDSDNDGHGNACDGDFNNDCIINFLDIAAFSDEFLGNNQLFDLNGDGAVNFLDFSRLSERFLFTPGPGLPGAPCGNL